MKLMRGSFLIAALFCLQGCSFSVRFFIINDGNTARTVRLELKKEKSGLMIFSHFNLQFYPVAGDNLNTEGRYSYSVKNADETQDITIPPRTALEIGHINNEKYENSRQNFINGRVFNFIRAKSGKSEVTRDTFETNFKKYSGNYAWRLPPE